MKTFKATLFFILSIHVSFLSATDAFTRKSESSFSESGAQGETKTIVNASFAIASFYDPKSKGFSDVLISQKTESVIRPGENIADSKIEVVAWIAGERKYDKKLWAIKDSADKGEIWKKFYRTTKHGCCGAEDVYRAFDLKTGKYLFSFTTEPVFVDVPNTPIKREISYVSAKAVADYGNSNLPADGVGVLTLSENGSRIDQILVASSDGELAFSPKISLINKDGSNGGSQLLLWQSNGIGEPKAVTGFSVKLAFNEVVSVVVPVSGDKFDLQKASLPKTTRILHVP